MNRLVVETHTQSPDWKRVIIIIIISIIITTIFYISLLGSAHPCDAPEEVRGYRGDRMAPHAHVQTFHIDYRSYAKGVQMFLHVGLDVGGG
jgi:hypothetical protein